MSISTVAAFWAVSFLLVITPGADWAYAIAAGLRHRTVLPAVGGMLAGYLLVTAVVAAGVAALVARSSMVLTVLTAAGAAYLVWLGIRTFARPSTPRAAAVELAESRATGSTRAYRRCGGLAPTPFSSADGVVVKDRGCDRPVRVGLPTTRPSRTDQREKRLTVSRSCADNWVSSAAEL